MTPQREKVLVAMSGGVDSSVAASLLVQAGYDVTGVFLCLGSAGAADSATRGCCSPQDAADARRVAVALGIDLHVLNCQDAFAGIIDQFVSEYAAGRTPNPCIRCNAIIKFARLVELADSLGAACVATGHYARRVEVAGQPAIARGKALGKDQSYALLGVAAEHIARILLPVGEIDDKATVRQMARSLGLAVHDKPDSQEICFVDGDDYVELLRRRAPQALQPGDIVNAAGAVLGRHEGFGQYTIGQRRGLGVAAGEPMYVTRIDPASAAVTIGPRAELMSNHLSASGANWHRSVSESFEATVQIRYNHRGAPARVTVTGPGTFDADFHENVSAVTPGQAAAVYDGPILLGGGWID
ncbi:MAG: tRNA 2-thiouridine(34) synthase MnmA [Phycisphaerae bacterium]|jgi:tRNA-specific 2-thiouridylase